MRWKRLPRAVSTSRLVDPVASATSSMVSVEPINVAISPHNAALALGKSVTSIASMSNDEGAVTVGVECARDGGQFAGWELTGAAGLSEDESHGQAPHP